MNFNEARTFLVDLFEGHNFTAKVKNSIKHSDQIKIDSLSNGSIISISFPGYKAYINNQHNKTIYDYRVDITKSGKTTSLSHSNIIIDIFNKIMHAQMNPQNLSNALIQFAQDGRIDMPKLISALPYDIQHPTKDLLQRAKKAHGNKFYNQAGNSLDLTIEELFHSLKWIVLQEDINYPPSQGFEGRKMPFDRYLETIFITQSHTHTLEEVIQRALSHKRPTQWTEMDYSFRNLIK